MNKYIRVISCLIIVAVFAQSLFAEGYKNFRTAVYCRVYEVNSMSDINWLKERVDYIEQHVKIDKVYLETFRDMVTAEEQTIIKAKKYFQKKGILVSGGITLVMSEPDRFRTFCYSNDEHLKKVEEIVKYTARFFDEIILDDFFFTSCKCELCIKKKGDRSWSDYRMGLLTDVSENIILKAAREVNPDVKVIIKYPNWYQHYHYLGYDLEHEPQIYDMIYTGTETRDPVYTQQHLQQYQSYSIMRYLENVKPGKNAGGWIDAFARRYLDRYSEQISLTLFAKPKEVTLFSFNYLAESLKNAGGFSQYSADIAPVAGNALRRADDFLDILGNPVGIPVYRPYHSSGEDFLENYIGMLGIPVDITPDFPFDSPIILLTENAKHDNDIADKIKAQLIDGKTVVITSGLLKSLQNKGIEDIAEVRCTDKKALTHEFTDYRTIISAEKNILIPQITYPTNDCWEIVTANSEGNGYPVLLQAGYGNGVMYILTIPDNFGDLYNLPSDVITMLKNILMKDIYVSTESKSQVSLFVYDNNTFIIHSFLPHRDKVKIVIKGNVGKLNEITSNSIIEGTRNGDTTEFNIYISPHSYQVFRID